MKRSLLISAILLLICFSTATADSAFPDLPQLSDARAFMVKEPIFQGQVFVYEAGRNHPISAVLIHGIGDEGARVWGHLIPELVQSYHVVTCDLPGFGRSTKANRLYSPENYREFVFWLANRYVKGPFVLIGHSMGGAVSLAYAANYPHKLQKLIVVDSGGILHRLALTRYIIHPNNNGTAQQPENYLTAWFNRIKIGAIEALEYPGLVNDMNMVLESPTMRQNFLGGNPAKISGLALVQFNFSRLLSRIETPTMVVWGENDDIAPLRTAKLLQAKLPRVELKILADAGHLPMIENPAEFNRAIIEQLARPIPPRSASLPKPTNRVMRYTNQNDIIITGGFKRIEISRCKGVRVVDAVAETMDIAGSEVELENCRIDGRDYGISVQSSNVIMTAVDIRGDVALTASRSKLDMAGVEIYGRSKAVQALDPSDLLFSVSRVKSPLTNAYMHGNYEISHRNPL